MRLRTILAAQMNHRTFMSGYTLLALVLIVNGCQTPNVEPFANATAVLRLAVIQGGAVVSETMTTSTDVADAKAFVEIWQDRVKLMDMLLGYSDAISGIAVAGAGAQQTVQTLGDAVIRLAENVPMSGSAVSQGVQLGQILIRTGIQIKAFNDLSEAVGAAHPTFVDVAKYLQADIEDLKTIYTKASQDLESEVDDVYGKRESQRHRLLSERDKWRDAMLNTFNDTNAERVKQGEELIAHMAPDHQEYVQRRDTLLTQRAAAVLMFDKAQQGVRAWVQAHDELKLAIEQKRQPNVRLVLSLSQEIKDAVDRIKNL
jgi:hypothetical protein